MPQLEDLHRRIADEIAHAMFSRGWVLAEVQPPNTLGGATRDRGRVVGHSLVLASYRHPIEAAFQATTTFSHAASFGPGEPLPVLRQDAPLVLTASVGVVHVDAERLLRELGAHHLNTELGRDLDELVAEPAAAAATVRESSDVKAAVDQIVGLVQERGLAFAEAHANVDAFIKELREDDLDGFASEQIPVLLWLDGRRQEALEAFHRHRLNPENAGDQRFRSRLAELLASAPG